MIDYQQAFIENVKFYRKKKGLSQSKLAELCDVSTGTIGNIECGITKPSFDLILLLADHLGVKPESLFYTSEQPEFSPAEDIFTKKQLQMIRKMMTNAVNEVVKTLGK